MHDVESKDRLVSTEINEAKSSVQLVLDELLKGLTAGEYAPGTRIVASDLCDRLGLSLAPVREALSILSGQGVVDILPNRGAVVRPMDLDGIIAFWPFIESVTKLGIRFATQKIGSEGSVEKVLKGMEGIRRAAKYAAPVDFYFAMNDYHFILHEIADNQYVVDYFNPYRIVHWERFLTEYFPVDKFRDDYVWNYQRLTDSIIRGDVEGAAMVWHYHVRWSIDILNGEPVEPGKPWIITG